MSAESTSGVSGAEERWADGLGEETDFWLRWLAEQGGEWGFDYVWRTDPSSPLQPYLTDNIPAPGDVVRILDVGSGPLTIVGKTWPGRTVEVTAVDPIADRYAALLAEAGVASLVPLVVGEAEKLGALFPASSFDLVYAQNCLDHSHDPLRCVREMLGVVKPGCRVALVHAIDEGEAMQYAGLHQWNFREEDGRFVIWRDGLRVDVTDAVSDLADVRAESFPEHRYLSVVLTRHAEGGTPSRWRRWFGRS